MNHDKSFCPVHGGDEEGEDHQQQDAAQGRQHQHDPRSV